MKVGKAPLCEMIRKACGSNRRVNKYEADPVRLVHDLWTDGCLNIPFESETLVLFDERIQVFKDLRQSPRRSYLLRNLLQSPDETLMVVDSMKTGVRAVMFIGLLRGNHGVWDRAAQSWISAMTGSKTQLVILSVDDGVKVIVASLISFLNLGDFS